jgi:hypothetical protein
MDESLLHLNRSGSIFTYSRGASIVFGIQKRLPGQAPEKKDGDLTSDPQTIGRPRKAADEARSERLSGIRLTPAERHVVELMAERAGVSVAEFARHAILGQRMPQRRTRGMDRAIVELNRVGVNLNQIAARVNMTGDLAGDFRAVMAEVRSAIETLTAEGAE